MEEENPYIGCRNNILDRSWVTELWMRVIQKAIDDLAVAIRMHEDGEPLSEEDKFNADTAYNFLFIDGYTISIGDAEKPKDITTAELISIWGCEDINMWREGIVEKLKQLVEEKRKAVYTRRGRL
jgi:hypothetical protein